MDPQKQRAEFTILKEGKVNFAEGVRVRVRVGVRVRVRVRVWVSNRRAQGKEHLYFAWSLSCLVLSSPFLSSCRRREKEEVNRKTRMIDIITHPLHLLFLPAFPVYVHRSLTM
jgi:hypothetical protein